MSKLVAPFSAVPALRSVSDTETVTAAPVQTVDAAPAVRAPRVMFYSHSGDVSGAEISLLLTLQGLKHTTPLLVAPDGDLLRRARGNGIPVLVQKSHRARMSRNPFAVLTGVIGTLAAGLRLRGLIRRMGPSVVHANSIRAGLIAGVATVGLRARLVWHVRDELPRNVIGRSIRVFAANRADAVVTISNAILDNFAPKGQLRSRCKVVYNGIDPLVRGKIDDLKGVMGLRNTAFVVGVVGQITPWKRQRDAITAFTRLLLEQPDAELWIVGSPKFRKENVEYEESLRAYARACGVETKVRFWGFCEDVMSIMQSIDVLLVPSENEPFGRVVIEAMLAGKPVVGTRGGGIPEIVQDGHTGFLVDIGDTTTMARLLSWLCADEILRRDMGERARNRAVKRFSIDRTCSELEATFEMLTVGPV
ncbi:glycosyltransferase family 4 protein [Alicyclobacillus curvatus]|nr:glycosyltransferase family 4 protein [Alicyclobacillus curvatus]